ncbi:MAG: hypothetical protein J3Q66DRAFT_388225 [Benniella sp.]|nr:MAG: hypothetical protein J3Q66DRAFT_388225 [Benniella sp.]
MVDMSYLRKTSSGLPWGQTCQVQRRYYQTVEGLESQKEQGLCIPPPPSRNLNQSIPILRLKNCTGDLGNSVVNVMAMLLRIARRELSARTRITKYQEVSRDALTYGRSVSRRPGADLDLPSSARRPDDGEIKYTVAEIKNMVSENIQLTARVFELQNTLDAKHEEMKRLQKQALDRLALLQNNVQALLTQTYELHEYPIPRLFVVLPDYSSSWDPTDFFSNKFRLYFLCECGEHTKATTKSRIPHHIHLAKHRGYEIDRPKEFFRQYGSYVLTILKMLKYGVTVAGVVIPALAQLIRVDALDQATESLRKLANIIEPGMDQVIDHFENVSTDESGKVLEVSQQTRNNEALEGADLRQLETFLKRKDENRVLGNLYRTVTGEGHVKWVCIDHCHENYHEKAAEAFRNAVEALQGSFDDSTGRVDVNLPSRLQAEQFYLALANARSVYELKVELGWKATHGDFEKLGGILAITNVGVLELHLPQHDASTRDILSRNQKYDPIMDIMRHQSIQSFTIRGSYDLTKRSSLLSRNYDFPNLRHLNISLDQLSDDTPGVKCLIGRKDS